MKQRDKLDKFIKDNQGTIGLCTRDDSKCGCLMCQEFYGIIDALLKEEAIEFTDYFSSVLPQPDDLGPLYSEWKQLTDNKDDRPYCDECGQPLTNDELNVGTCEDCLCPE